MYNLSISNIAWSADLDIKMFSFMKKMEFSGLEIAPTRIFPENPYEHIFEVKKWSEEIKREYGFFIPSIQSIWFGRTERIFGTQKEKQCLIDYTKKAIDFAQAIGSRNLVFGCPRNRMIPDNTNDNNAIAFFREIGEYALQNDTVIGMEANPLIYNTNYINTTIEALELIKRVNSKGFKLNLDLGTMIYNEEDSSILYDSINVINHIHISEPGLMPIQKRRIHQEIKELISNQYDGFVSIEMSKDAGLDEVQNSMVYVREVFQ